MFCLSLRPEYSYIKIDCNIKDFARRKLQFEVMKNEPHSIVSLRGKPQEPLQLTNIILPRSDLRFLIDETAVYLNDVRAYNSKVITSLMSHKFIISRHKRFFKCSSVQYYLIFLEGVFARKERSQFPFRDQETDFLCFLRKK